MKIVYVLLLMILLCSIFVTSVPPFGQETIVTEDPDRLDIVYPKQTYYQKDSDLTLQFHVFNASQRIIHDANVVQCEIHVYDKHGNHSLIDNNMSTAHDDYYVNLNSSFTSEIGFIPYNMWCWYVEPDARMGGGFVSEVIEITESGKQAKDGGGSSVVGIIALLVCFLLYLGYEVNKNGEYRIFKLLFIFVAFVITVVGAYAVRAQAMSHGMLLDVTGTLNATFTGMIWVFVTVTLFGLVFYIKHSLELWKEVQKQKY